MFFFWCTLAWQLYWCSPFKWSTAQHNITLQFFPLISCHGVATYLLFRTASEECLSMCVFTSHRRSQNICLWLHCSGFMADLECFNDSSIYVPLRRNDRPTTLLPQYSRINMDLDTFVPIIVTFCLVLSRGRLLFSLFHDRCISHENSFALGCNMSIKSIDTRISLFSQFCVSRRFLFIIFHFETTHLNSNEFLCLYQPVQTNVPDQWVRKCVLFTRFV